MRDFCCPGDECKGWFSCVDGDCRNPFEADPSTDLSICEQVEEGRSDKSRRDWCYWYAAYHKGDTAICEHVEWSQMREKCQDGEDPAGYFVISF